MKPKILFIMHMPPPIHGASMVGKFIHDSKLVNESFDCWYISPSTANNIQDIAKINCVKIFRFVFILLRIARILIFERPDLVYYTATARKDGFRISYIIVTWIRLFNRNIVVHFHNKGVCENKKGIDGIIRKSFFRNIKVILLSHYLYYDIEDWVDKKDVLICPNGIPQTNTEKIVRKNSVPHLLFLSNLIKSKGVYVLLDACKILKDKGEQFVCDFVGAESKEISESIFLAEVSRRGLCDFVKYHGRKYGAEKDSYFKHADIFVFPTYYESETFGLVNLEAMQYQLPIVTTNVGGIPDVVKNGINGIVCERNNVESLANAIETLLSNSEMRKEMGNAGYEKFKNEFTLDIFERNFTDCIKQCLKSYG